MPALVEPRTLAAQRTLGAFLALACAMGIGRFAYTPILPYMIADTGLSVSAAGYVASANFAGYLAGTLLAGARYLDAARERWAVVGLAASVLTTAAMALTEDPWPLAAIRLASGVASAFVQVFASSLVLEAVAAANRPMLAALPYAGVGTGIAASALLVELAARLGGSSATMWVVVGVAALLFAAGALGGLRPLAAAHGGARPRPSRPSATLPPNVRRALRWLTAGYGCLGFGYVITGTFLLVMVRALPNGRSFEALTWAVTGLAAIPSNLLWLHAAQRWGYYRALAAAYVLEGIGVALAGVAGGVAGVLAGALLLGGTFMAITALAFAVGRELDGGGSRMIVQLTAAFGVGQAIGPAAAGWLAERVSGFAIPSLIAAAVLIAAAGMTLVSERLVHAPRAAART